MSKVFGMVAGVLLALVSAASAAVTLVTVTGNIDNLYGNPCVYCHVDIYALGPTIIGGGNGTLVTTNPGKFETNTAGAFTGQVVGGIMAALYVEETGALLKTSLPTSGTVTLATIQAAQPNVVGTFPPLGNLSMGGFRFTTPSLPPIYDNMAGAYLQSGAFIEIGQVALATGTATVVLGAAFTSSTSYKCTGSDSTAVQPIKIANVDGAHFTITGTGTDVIVYHCAGS